MKKNILIFCHSPATQFIDICNQYSHLFAKDQYSVTVAYLTGAPNSELKAKNNADHVIFFNLTREAARGLKLPIIQKVLQLCREKKFQVVICHRYKPTYVMLWVAQFIRIPALFFVMHELGTLQRIPRKLLISGLSRKNMFFAGVSNAVRDDLAKNLWRIPAERIITLHNMIDTITIEKEFLPRDIARQQLQLPQNAFVFGNIGRLAPNKDQATLIKAFANIKPQFPQAKLLIMGNGSLDYELNKQAQLLGVAEDIIFTGFMENGYRYAKAFDVYISSSKQEAFGRVLLEAMLAKIPVIATAVNGVPEVMGNAGKLIPVASATHLANEMSQAIQLDGQALTAWGEQGYQRVIENFSFAKFNEIFWGIHRA